MQIAICKRGDRLVIAKRERNSRGISRLQGLALTATQEEMDNAAQALNAAIDALQEKTENGGAGNPGDNPENPGDNPENPADPGSGSLPQTGDSNAIGLFAACAAVSGGVLLALLLRKRQAAIQ